MKKKIKFIAAEDEFYNVEDPPVPSKNKIPEWFKRIPPEGKDVIGDPRSRGTVKKCIPFLDAMTAGYMVCAPQDISVFIDDEGVTRSSWGVVYNSAFELLFDIDRPPHRTKGMPVPKGYDADVWRMSVYPRIETPKGYSVLVTHPFNRYDLPFLTLSAVIDSDAIQSKLAVNMYLRKDFEGIIEKGTPVAQVLPFRREDWEHENLPPLPPQKALYESFKIRSVLERSYMRQFWTKKSYD
jgi:hypothetical protein